MQRTHDMGGLPGGEIDLSPHELAPWQKETWAMRQVLGSDSHGLVRTDELRRAIEDLDPADYNRMAYFERWITAVRNLLVEKGILGQDEIERRVAELRRKRPAAE